jgi:hypothetical protein
MPAAIDWSEEMTAELLRLRRLGLSAKEVSERLGISAHACWGQLARVGDPAKEIPPQPPPPGAVEGPERNSWGNAMRPGHPVSWGALTSGTVLDGLPYPSRVDQVVGKLSRRAGT